MSMPLNPQNVLVASPVQEQSQFVQNSPSNTTVRQLASSPSLSASSPMSTSTSRLVALSGMSIAGVNARKRTATGGSQAGLGLKTSPIPPAQTRSRSRISQSGSMANLMNLVRSRSRSRVNTLGGEGASLEDAGETGWFGKARNLVKTFGDSDTEDEYEDPDSPAAQQKRTFNVTRELVLLTLKKILGCAGEVALEVLIGSTSLLEHAPVPCLQTVCSTFISIWKAVQMINMNRLAFLRLVQTCSSILEAITSEVDNADELVVQELKGPISVLETDFDAILSSVRTQINTPFLWRYARREDTNKEIAGCHEKLMKTLTLFTAAVQIKTFKAVRDNTKLGKENQAQLAFLREQVVHGSPSQNTLRDTAGFPTDLRRASAPEGLPPANLEPTSNGVVASPSIVSKSVDNFFPAGGVGRVASSRYVTTASGATTIASAIASSQTVTPAFNTPSSFSSRALAATTTAPHAQVIPVLQELQSTQNAEDRKADSEEMRRIMRSLLDRGNDFDILRFLGIDERDIPEAIKTLQRMLESLCGGVGWGGQGPWAPSGETNDEGPDVLHKEFIEAGIEALRRMSSGAPELPYWTITMFEVKKGPKIGAGFFSDVFMGQWGKRFVAVKVLSEVTPSDLFIREIKVWKDLEHPNVLRLYGASSATGNPPWFFVSEYMRYGNLAEFLRRVGRLDEGEMKLIGWGGKEQTELDGLTVSRSVSGMGGGGFGSSPKPGEWPAFGGIQRRRVLRLGDVYRMMQEVARGMEYIHVKGVLHGDLKASNVLVDDNYRCVISDFGQSELKTEVCRLTGSSMNTGTLRWKAPELLEGSGMLTPFTDIYAYGIVCIEILTMGEIPWGCTPDNDIRCSVIDMDKRPMIPLDFTSPLLREVIQACWQREPVKRMPFVEVVSKLTRLRIIEAEGSDPSFTNFSIQEEGWDDSTTPSSPCASPVSSFSRPRSPTPTPHADSVEYFDCSDDFIALPSPQEVHALQMEDDIVPKRNSAVRGSGIWKMPEPIFYDTELQLEQGGSQGTDTTVADSENGLSRSVDLDGKDGRHSPPPTNARAVEARNERRYRYLLEHEFNSSLTLPLWEPSQVSLGDVGYLSKPRGAFVTLFSAIKPARTDTIVNFSSIAEYGNVSRGSLKLSKRNVAQKGIDAFSGFLAFRAKGEAAARRQSFRLRAGHKSAYLYTESAEYAYMKKLDAAKAWFKDNIDEIIVLFGKEHGIQREDVFLVISALHTKDYALIVSHRHRTGQAHFNVHSSAKRGQPWGAFDFDANIPSERHGPTYEEPEHVHHEYACKISSVHDSGKAVLVGRLRFKPDSKEPTTSK